MWFEQLFGFREADWAATQARFSVRGEHLRSRVNDRSFRVGRFTTPSLSELRLGVAEARADGLLGGRATTVRHEAIGDVLELHARPENSGAMFQVASQFNCLEFVNSEVTPEHGVTGYAFDPTQGPACSLAAGAATVYRNYFAPVGGEIGQRAYRQIDNLDGLAAALGPPDAYWTVRNGYTHSDRARLAALDEALTRHDRDDLLGHVKIGVHAGVGVTFVRRYEEPAGEPVVSQAFCSAISCAYTDLPRRSWRPLATLVLDATYEATLLAAALDAARGNGSGRVWLTFIGGGVFGNDDAWIASAIRRFRPALRRSGPGRAHRSLSIHPQGHPAPGRRDPMTTWVALLRSINVGGRNKVPMAELRALATSLGLEAVRTYIQSGNLVFRSALPREHLAAMLREAIRGRFELEVPVVLRTHEELVEVEAANPFAEAAATEPKLVAVFFLDGPVEVELHHPTATDPFVARGDVIYVHYPSGSARSKLNQRWFERQTGRTGTARNWRTLGKIIDLTRA